MNFAAPLRTQPSGQLNRNAIILIIGGVLAAAGAVLSAATVPYAGFAGIAVLALLAVILRNPRAGLLTVVAVLYVLPFGVIPIPLGSVRLTFLDASLTLTLLVWLAAGVTSGRGVRLSPIGGALLVFLFLAATAFIMGIESTPPESVRLFLKLFNSILLFFTVVNIVRTQSDLRAMLRAVMLGTAGAATLALAFYVVPTSVSGAVLASLARLGYPEQQVLRYIADTEVLRATGTAVDPNVLGGMLLLVVPLLFTQLFGPTPLLDRRLLTGILIVVAAALVLSYSRGSWIGAMAGCLFVGTVQYRRIWLALAIAVAVILVTPQGDFILERFQDGVNFEDRASQMRLGEYKDALRLIERYPFLGVGFGRAPELDIYVASSSIYLMMASQMGLIGLSAFLAAMAVLYRSAVSARRRMTDAGLRSLQLGVLGGVTGALAAGLFDHYFFNLVFPHTGALFWLTAGLTVAATAIGEAPAVDRDTDRSGHRKRHAA